MRPSYRRRVAAAAQKQIQITLHWITDSHGCKVWDSQPSANESVSWSGPCVDGYAEGKGTLTWFVNGKPYGTYEGELKGGHYNGEGTQIWPSGARYDGGWKNDRADGRGTYRNLQGEVLRRVDQRLLSGRRLQPFGRNFVMPAMAYATAFT